jgi:hypothetical protein
MSRMFETVLCQHIFLNHSAHWQQLHQGCAACSCNGTQTSQPAGQAPHPRPAKQPGACQG